MARAIKKRFKLIVFFIAFLIIAPAVLLYARGDILGTGWTLLATGGIYVNSAPSGAKIFLNNKPYDTTSFFNRDIVMKSLRAGNYEIKVTEDGYNSWSKKIAVFNNLVTDANVFMLQEKIDQREITKYLASSTEKNSEYADILAVFAKKAVIIKSVSTTTVDLKSNLGTKLSPIMSGKIGLWKEGNKIYSKWFGRDDLAPRYFCNDQDCTKTILVADLGSTPSKVDFLPDYSGVAVVSLDSRIFAIQIEENPEKKEQLIYQGKVPDFRIIDGSLYVKDGNYLAEIML